ncbi:MAG: protein translocase subunit SecF [Pseudomonadales bacterium]
MNETTSANEQTKTAAPAEPIAFMSWRKIALVVSALFLVASIASLATRGIVFGLDFTGGTQVEVGYSEAPQLEELRASLETAGFRNAVAVHFGSETDILVRLQNDEKLQGMKQDEVGTRVLEALRGDSESTISLRRIEFVGPQVGEELREQGGLALIIALLVVMVYIAMRFQFKFSVGAVAALAHDVVITLGFFSIFGWDFDLTVLAALLAVIGYSLNDTIVVADRIRENFRMLRKQASESVINISLTQTLGRTLVTSLTTILVLATLFFIGGELINGFAKALLIGVVVGTYSSIYVASNVLLMMNISKEDLMVPEKEGVAFDDGMP